MNVEKYSISFFFFHFFKANLELAKILFENGADFNVANILNQTSIYFAVKTGNQY